MNRDELIEKMCVAAFNDQGELGWENCRKAGNKNLGLVRERMARVLDVVESELRAGGIEAGRALMALHAATARKEGRSEGLRTALVVAQNQNSCAECGGALSMCDSIEALIAKAEADL